MENLITVIDFSASGLRLVTGYYFKGSVYVLQAMEGEPIHRNLQGFLDKKETEDSLSLLLQEAKRKLKNELGVYIALLPPDGFLVKSDEGKSATVDTSSRITQMDYVNCINQINKKTKTDHKHIVYDDPFLFGDDNKRNQDSFPEGNASDQLEVHADSQMVDDASFSYYESILKDLHLDIYMYLIAPFCTVSFINFFEVPSSYVLLDIEKNYSYLSYVYERRMNESIQLSFGIDDIVSSAKDSLKRLDGEKTLEYLNLFGLRNESGFVFQTEEGITLKDTSSAFEKALVPLLDATDSMLKRHEAGREVPLILSGPGSDIEELDGYFVKELKRETSIFFNKVIGARNKVYANCLGAILISSYKYQTPIQEARRKEGDTTFLNHSFSRNK